MKCPECGKDVSDRAATCVHCGFPLCTQNAYLQPSVSDNESINDPASEVDNEKSGVAHTKRFSILSILSLAVSIIACAFYSASFKAAGFVPLFVIASIASIILPVIAKKERISKSKKGKVFEIIAIVIGGFDFYCIIFALTKLPILIAYLGWIVSALTYKVICAEKKLEQR